MALIISATEIECKHTGIQDIEPIILLFLLLPIVFFEFLELIILNQFFMTIVTSECEVGTLEAFGVISFFA